MLIFNSVEELAEYEGKELGVSDWLCVDQAMIDAFAAVTNDYQWIHVDREKAAASPLGSTIAHGYLILSLIPALGDQVYKLNNVEVAINAGLNWLRFVQPVKAGQHVRARIKVSKVQVRAVGPSGDARCLFWPSVGGGQGIYLEVRVGYRAHRRVAVRRAQRRGQRVHR